MQLFFITLQSILMLIAISFIGIFLLQRKVVPEKMIESLSPLVLEVALPALIFSKLISNFHPHQTPEKLLFPFYGVLFIFLRFALSWIASFISKKDIRNEMRVTLLFQNATFVPLIVISAIFGKNSNQLNELFLFTMFYPAIFFNTYFLFFKQKRKEKNWKVFFHPMTIATIVAILLKATQTDGMIPAFILQSAEMVGQMTIPLLMITLGGIIYVDFKEHGKFEIKEVITFVVINNILYPCIALMVLYYARLNSGLTTLILIQSAVPPLTALPVVMSRVGGNRGVVNQFLVASFIFSAISIPLFIYLTQKFLLSF